ncbi:MULTISPECIES: (2,3-dihydroxybenzoyl)adenylate synthase [Bacillota]|uniref:AMP-binding protein n=2 Tax=Streptococcus anginosus TaxID=1328 RepID=A0AAP6BP96_STRAP|nr:MULTISPECIES: AMP-binding protein [Bacillota]MDK8240266.1 AMP-binding protein [Gemella morbillorum]MDK8254510.1 AMP-binding protein [Gemella morbillorum]MDX5040067.1 AMP-binding protein [Streptococcus anginosus]SFE36901.1 yersiniabactin salicyl-AMP ligase [Peptostreptococcus sp. D1]
MNIELKENLEKFYDEDVWEHMTLGEFITNCSEMYKDKTAIVDGDTRLSYKELDKLSNKYANGLLKAGFKKGDKIVLQLPNCYEFIAISFAMFKTGIIPIMSLPAHRKNELKGIIEKSEAVAYIAKDRYLGFSYVDMIRDIKSELNKKLEVYILGDNQEYKKFLSLIESEYPYEYPDVDYKNIGLLLLSGGTTGIPKLIPRRHCDYIYVAKKTGDRCNVNQESVYLASLPIAHNFPLGCPGIVGTFAKGGKVVLCNVTSPDEILPLIEEENVTITGFVPAIANICMDYLEYEEYDLSSLELIQVGGSVLESWLAEKIEKVFDVKLQQIFGIAEGLILTTNKEDNNKIRWQTQGKPISEHDEILIVDEKGKEVEVEEYGELIVRGPYTIYGYYNLPEVNEICMTEDCYFRTGDKARKLKDGNYQIVGRIKEIINRAGEKITPSELEEILLTHEHINSVQVVGIPDCLQGEAIAVFILNGNKELTLEEVRKFLISNNVADFKLPDKVKYIDAWPLTALGKIDRNKLKETF